MQTEEDFASWGIDWPDMEATYRASRIEVRRRPVADFNPEALRQRLPSACKPWTNCCGRDTWSRALHAGMNRSPSVVVAYLHWVRGLGLDEAVDYVLLRHPCDPYGAIRLATADRMKNPRR